MVKRGEVWLTSLDPIVGNEIQKTRPCLIVSPMEMHDHLRTALIAPMTTGGRETRFRIRIRFEGKDGFVAIDQLRAVDKGRLARRLGTSSHATLTTVLDALREAFED